MRDVSDLVRLLELLTHTELFRAIETVVEWISAAAPSVFITMVFAFGVDRILRILAAQGFKNRRRARHGFIVATTADEMMGDLQEVFSRITYRRYGPFKTLLVLGLHYVAFLFAAIRMSLAPWVSDDAWAGRRVDD